MQTLFSGMGTEHKSKESSLKNLLWTTFVFPFIVLKEKADIKAGLRLRKSRRACVCERTDRSAFAKEPAPIEKRKGIWYG